MELEIGQKVAYPGQGVCLVESINTRVIGNGSVSVYLLRVIGYNSTMLKQLTYLSHEKRLSFREQTLLEKAKFLIVSEITNANLTDEETVRTDVVSRVETACTRHVPLQKSASDH